MSTQSKNESERQQVGKQIAEAIDQAQTALNRFDATRKRSAKAGVDPDSSSEVYDALILLDSAVMNAYRKLRKYIKDDLNEDYWNKQILGTQDGQPILLGGRPQKVIDSEGEERQLPKSALFIEDFQGEVNRHTREEHVEFEGVKQRVYLEPKLMPVGAYRTAVNLLDEIRGKLGFAPEAQTSVPRTEITEEMIEEVEQWRARNLE